MIQGIPWVESATNDPHSRAFSTSFRLFSAQHQAISVTTLADQQRMRAYMKPLETRRLRWPVPPRLLDVNHEHRAGRVFRAQAGLTTHPDAV